jgi:hypothetical protein
MYPVSRLIKLLLAFASTVIPGFNLLKTYDQYFCSFLDMYVFRNSLIVLLLMFRRGQRR